MRPRPSTGRTLRSRLTALGAVGACSAAAWFAAPRSGAVEAEDPVIARGFPFQGLTVDLRDAGGGIVPRGLVLPLGDSMFACFDIDLLRPAAVWHGEEDGLEYAGIGTLSYARPKAKAEAGQSRLTRPRGDILTITPPLPGAAPGHPLLTDPRDPGPDARDVGRGPLPEEAGMWMGVHRAGSRAILEYRCGATTVRELHWTTAPETGADDSEPVVGRTLRIGASAEPLFLLAGAPPGGVDHFSSRALAGPAASSPSAWIALRGEPAAEFYRAGDSDAIRIRVPPSESERMIHVLTWRSDRSDFDAARVAAVAARIALPEFPDPPFTAPPLWPESIAAEVEVSPAVGAGYVSERIGLPLSNPWQRPVRPSAIAFHPDGRGVIATIDGDVWTISGLSAPPADAGADAGAMPTERPLWRRIAAGIHEPQGLAIRGTEIFVFGRNGVERLHDRNGDGEIDEHESFCHRFTQSAESRDYALDLVLRPDGGFYLVKGGQQTEFRTRHSGRILSISPDGNDVRIHADGLRNAFLGIHPETGLLTAGDQQGHWIPATPIHVIREGGYYGFHPAAPPGSEEPAIEPPFAWIPHRAAQSATGQVWLTDPRAGPLAGSLLLLDYFRPGLLAVHVDPSGSRDTGAVAPIPVDVPAPVLKAAVHPGDGLPYFVGFQIWGTASDAMTGFFRLRWTGGPDPMPRSIIHGRQGVVLEFAAPLDPRTAEEPSSYLLQRWNYVRSAEYGSGHFLRNGDPGQERVAVAGAHLSPDGRHVFLHVPHMTEVMQMSVHYDVRPADARTPRLTSEAYFSVRDLPELDLAALGFAPVDLAAEARASRLARRTEAATEASVARGRALHATMGCVACHSIDGSTEGKTGPTWAGLFGSTRPLAKGDPVKADRAYLIESILDPAAKVVKGFNPADVGMPSYQGILSDEDLESIVLYIRSLGQG